jgi:hypothetical protein
MSFEREVTSSRLPKMRSFPTNTRRWQRHLVDLPVRILPRNGISQTVLPGRGIEISEGGMALYVGVHLEPGDLMDVEFETFHSARVTGIVCSKAGYCFGLEFLTPLLAGDRSVESPQEARTRDKLSERMADSYTALDQELELPRPRSEIDVSKYPAGMPFFVARETGLRNEPKLNRILNDVAAKALQATGATGVAIGLGREDAMICYAAAGLPFADLGGRINTESGLTAAAIRRQMSQWCNDTESDTRVDVEVCRQLGVRSIIVVPICARDTGVGLIAIISANPDAFSLSDLHRVKELAQWASEAIESTTAGNVAAEAIAPVITRPDHLERGHRVDVNSVRTHGIELRRRWP